MDFIHARSLLEKRMLDIASGSFVGHVVAVLIDEKEMKLKSFGVQHDDDSIYYVDASLIEHLDGEYLVVERLEEHEEAFGRNILGMPVITVKGELVGEVVDFLLNEANHIESVILSGDYIQSSVKGNYGEVAANHLTMIGKEVILSEQDRKDIHINRTSEIKEEAKKTAEDVEDLFESVSHKAKESVSGFADRMKDIDTDQLNRDFNRFAGSVNKEVSRLFDSISERFNKKDRNQSAKEDDIRAIMHDIGGYTVTEMLKGADDQIILMPGQHIDEKVVEQVLDQDLVTMLYRVAVPVAKPDVEEMQAEEVTDDKEEKNE